MITPSGPSLENLTLSDADLAACQPVAGEGGHVLRALCPFHGSDHQRSLRVTRASGRFVCFACGAWGYLEEARERWQEEQQHQAALRKPPAHAPRPPRQRPAPPPAALCPTPSPQAPRDPAAGHRRSRRRGSGPGSRGAGLARWPLDGLCALLEEAARRRPDALPLAAVAAQLEYRKFKRPFPPPAAPLPPGRRRCWGCSGRTAAGLGR
jgi:hypothetical protein